MIGKENIVSEKSTAEIIAENRRLAERLKLTLDDYISLYKVCEELLRQYNAVSVLKSKGVDKMTDEEAKQAFLKQCSVVERNRSARSDIHYKCISALIYRLVNGKPALSVELADRSTNSVTIAKPDTVREEIS